MTAPLASHHICILVVEDDFIARLCLAEELADAGYNVRQAGSADNAVAMVDFRSFAVAALVTDINMPGRYTGIDLAGLMRCRLPHIPIIYTTGRPAIIRHHLGANQILVSKPYAPRDIIAHIQAMLSN